MMVAHEQDALERLLIPRQILSEMQQYCEREKTVEVCGLLGGVGEFAQSFYPTKNIAEDPSHGYLMDPEEQIQAMDLMRQRREQLLGIFHSHPNSAAEPSPTDLALAAYPGVAYLIASLKNDEATFRSFLFTGKQFEKLPLVLAESAG